MMIRKLAGLRRFWRRFSKDRRGAVAILIAIAIVPLLAAVGIATDVARGYTVKSRLSSAVDAAALAGARVYFQDRRDSDVEQFFEANFPPGYMNAAIDGPDIQLDTTANTLSVSARATIPTTFMRLVGRETMSVSAYAEVTRETNPMDIVLAMDMSGSMTWNLSGGWWGSSRLEHAKSAALKLVDILYGDETEKNLLQIGLVPWAGAVNVTLDGTSFGYDEFGNELSDAQRVTTQSVTNFVNRHRDFPDDPWDPYQTHKAVNAENNQTTVYYAHNAPVPLLSEPIFDPNTNNPTLIWSGCVWARWDQAIPDSDTADKIRGLTAAWPGWEPMGADTLVVPGTSRWPRPLGERCPATRYTNVGRGRPRTEECTPCPESGITPMQKSRAVIEGAINSLTIGNPEGTDYYTNIPHGLAWAWRVVHPEPPFTEGQPPPGDDYERIRAIILLTDGENTWRAGDAYNGMMPNRNQRDTRLKEIAQNAKDEGIYIYAIQFANSSGELADLMKEVATKPNAPYYFNAPSDTELEEAFQEIANHLATLRLSR